MGAGRDSADQSAQPETPRLTGRTWSWCSSAAGIGLVRLQLLQVRQQLVLARQAEEVIAEHLVGPLGRFPAGPQAQQHAGDDRAVSLQLDSVLAVEVEMPAAEDLFEESEE